MKVRCNNCDNVYVDDGEIHYEPWTPGLDPHPVLVRMDIPNEPGERNDCCPVCRTDEYLMDLEDIDPPAPAPVLAGAGADESAS